MLAQPQTVHRQILLLVLICSVIIPITGCPETTNPFISAPTIARDSQPHRLNTDIVSLGQLSAGQVINLELTGDAIVSFLLLTPDTLVPAAGTIVGGGIANQPANYRVPADNEYFLFTQPDPNANVTLLDVTLTVSDGDDSFTPPTTQRVLITFDDNFLTDPGLFDPDSGTQEQQDLLAEISDQVRDGIIERLNTIFAGTPIEIFDEREGQPDAPFSTLTFSPERVEANVSELSIDAVATPLSDRPECDDVVIFGEVLPRGAGQDPGNQIQDDDAVVYVGSFQGRGETCQSSAIDSVNNIVMGLAQTGAHEIGHLVGLYHVALFDIMDRSPSMAFQRELDFARGQVLVEQEIGTTGGQTDIATIVLTNIIQDPAIYFDAVFSETDR